MPVSTSVNRAHVLAAISEYDRLGSREFLQRYGFTRASSHSLWHGGNEYEAKAILGVAYLLATGRAASWDEVTGREDDVAKVLKDLNFDVVANEEAAVSKRPRKAAPRKTRTAAASAKPQICPRCHMALPASGVCDFCD